MGQVSPFLRRVGNGYMHWCPACCEVHLIGDGWTFDGNLARPTFSPSVKVTGKRKVIVDGKWTGDWVRDASGNALDHCCHYFLQAGELRFCGDCTHAFAGRTAPLPELPQWLRDPGDGDPGRPVPPHGSGP